jgi:hypothetical protein
VSVSASAVPAAVTVGERNCHHVLIAAIISRPVLFTSATAMPSGQPSGGVLLLLAAVLDQEEI